MNDNNLIPLNRRTPAERERIARLGGIKSGESRRAWAALKKYFYEQIKIDSYVEDYIISHAMKKRYCGKCKYKRQCEQRKNKERSSKKNRSSET